MRARENAPAWPSRPAQEQGGIRGINLVETEAKIVAWAETSMAKLLAATDLQEPTSTRSRSALGRPKKFAFTHGLGSHFRW